MLFSGDAGWASGEGSGDGAAIQDCGRERGEKRGELLPAVGWMGNCKDRRLPCLTISACDVVRERAWVGMKGGGEGSTRVAEEVVDVVDVVEAAEGVEEAELPESC